MAEVYLRCAGHVSRCDGSVAEARPHRAEVDAATAAAGRVQPASRDEAVGIERADEMPSVVGRVILHFHTAEIDAASHVDVLRFDVIESGLQQPVLQRRDACCEACVILCEDKKVLHVCDTTCALADAARVRTA